MSLIIVPNTVTALEGDFSAGDSCNIADGLKQLFEGSKARIAAVRLIITYLVVDKYTIYQQIALSRTNAVQINNDKSVIYFEITIDNGNLDE